MPPRVTFAAGQELDRKGNSDFIQTNRGRRPVRVFDARTGRWRLTWLGKCWFAQNELSQFVVQIPAKFYTTKADGRVVEHEGRYPVTDLDPHC